MIEFEHPGLVKELTSVQIEPNGTKDWTSSSINMNSSLSLLVSIAVHVHSPEVITQT